MKLYHYPMNSDRYKQVKQSSNDKLAQLLKAGGMEALESAKEAGHRFLGSDTVKSITDWLQEQSKK